MGTIGPLKLINDLPENFLLMNGDILTDLNFSRIFNKHISNKNIFTINSFERSERVDFGVIEINKNKIVKNFLEKPNNNYLVNIGYLYYK